MRTLKRKYEGSTFFNSRNLITYTENAQNLPKGVFDAKCLLALKEVNMLDPTKLGFKCIYS